MDAAVKAPAPPELTGMARSDLGVRVAYFSMEIGLVSAIPTYAGGLGVLAGDTLRAAADAGLPMVAVTLVHRRGYFRQHLAPDGLQVESDDPWSPEGTLDEMAPRVVVTLEGRPVVVRAFRYTVRGVTGREVPVYLLDTELADNAPEDRALSHHLYGGDQRYRLAQEMVLGLGGVAMLEALGHTGVNVYHMNEGHSALLGLALFERQEGSVAERVQVVRKRCVFTTHTPVPAGHDQFPIELVRSMLGQERTTRLMEIDCHLDGALNMTHMALVLSHYINGVAMRHGQISRGMFPGYPIASITNGVHAATWVASAFAELFDRHIPDWRQQNDNLRYAVGISLHEIRQAHERSKAELVAEVARRSGVALSATAMTLGFARRATAYKRADLLLADLAQLERIAKIGPLQIVYAGKAHPRDEGGKRIIQHVFQRAAALSSGVRVVYLENYDMALARCLCAGVDVWLNTPQKPEEASGTSGMKAALNAVPSLSVLDGWWIEGHVEDVTGWSIGDSWEPEPDVSREVSTLYRKLEQTVAAYYGRPESFARVMRYAVALNGSFFNAQRMIEQYAQGAYGLHMSR